MAAEALARTVLESRRRKSAVRAWKSYLDVCSSGMDGNTVIGNYLVPMFVDCGSLLQDAKRVFMKLADHQNEISWTSMIQGFADFGKVLQAFDLFYEMQEKGVYASAFTYQVLLNTCSRIKFVEGGHLLYMEIIKESFEHESLVMNSLVDMYAKCGSLTDACASFGRLLHRDVVSWTVMIGAYRDQELTVEVFHCWEQMQLEGVSPNAVTFASVLSTCTCGSMMESLDRGWEIHAAAIKDGFEQDPFVGNVLIDMYGKHGYLTEAKDVFDELITKDVVSWTALITAYAKHGSRKDAWGCMEQMEGQGGGGGIITPNVVSWNAIISELAEHGLGLEALQSLEKMRHRNISPDVVTLTSATKACSKIGEIAGGRMLHSEIVTRGYEKKDPIVGNALVDMYSKCGFMEEAREVFDAMEMRDDIISWASLMSGYAEHGMSEEVGDCLSEMKRKGVPLTNSTCNAVIVAFAEAGMGEEALKCFGMMRLQGGLAPDDATYACILRASCSTNWISSQDILHSGRCIHCEVVKSGLQNDPFVASSLMEMYVKCGMLREAEDIFGRLLPHHRDCVLWSILTAAYADHGLADQALKCVRQMQEDHICLTTTTSIRKCLRACNVVGSFSIGRSIHLQIVKQGLDEGDDDDDDNASSSVVSNALVAMYANHSLFADAHHVVDKLSGRRNSAASWTPLVWAYAEKGMAGEAMECLRRMRLEDGISPDFVTRMWCLRCASSLGMVSWGRELHGEIVSTGLLDKEEPGLGSVLVEFYARQGLFREARKVLLEAEDDDASWRALCAGYLHNNLCREALNCAEEMQQRDISPTMDMFVCCLKACGAIACLVQGHELHSTILKRGLERGDSFIGNTTLHMYASCGSLLEAQAVFGKLGHERNVVSWNALMRGYAENGQSEQVVACAKRMEMEGVKGDGITVVSLLKGCGSLGMAEKGREIHMEAAKAGMEQEEGASSALIDMYAKCGCLEEAHAIFFSFFSFFKQREDSEAAAAGAGARDLVSWTALMTGYAIGGEVEKVVRLVEEMERRVMGEGAMGGDSVTFLAVLTACCHGGLVRLGEEYFCRNHVHVHVHVLKRSSTIKEEAPPLLVFASSAHAEEHYNCVVDMVGRAGKVQEALETLARIPLQPSLMMWNTVLGACRRRSHYNYWEEEGEGGDHHLLLLAMHALDCAHELIVAVAADKQQQTTPLISCQTKTTNVICCSSNQP